MRSNFSKTAAIFFTPETLLPFLVGSVFLAVLGNAIWQLLVNWLGTSTPAAVGIAIGSLLIFGLAVYFFGRGLNKLEPRTLLGARTPDQRRGLIVLVSRELPCQIAIRHHLGTLEQCWLLHSSWEQSTAAVEHLMQEFGDQPGLQLKPILISEIHNPLHYVRCIRQIYANLPVGWSVDDVIADYTGMTASASVGMAIASLQLNAPLQYTPEDPKTPQASMKPIEIVLRRDRR